MSVQRTPDRRGTDQDNEAIQWEEDLKPFTRLPREKPVERRQRVPSWVPGLISIALVAVACSMAVNFVNRSQGALNRAFAPSTATSISISPTPTDEFPPTATPFMAATETPLPQPTIDGALTGGITVGGKVRVFDTGNGLNFRRGPSRNAALIKKLPDGETLEVMGGPTQADNFIWWQLKDSAGVVGWGVQTYLQATQ